MITVINNIMPRFEICKGMEVMDVLISLIVMNIMHQHIKPT